ncbi:hypothetical protein J4230_04195, partial [Candidatus Woesearchaeota archaeon]|nr:hypothetical protein [Candidatus Woesearchaeota archaeon]
MAGVTVTGALAGGLEVLPAPFGSSPATNVVVYGAAGTDVAAVNDVVVGLGGIFLDGLSELTLSDFETGERNDISVGSSIDSEFGSEIDETDGAGLISGKVVISTPVLDDEIYNFHEAIDVGSGVNLTTALDIGDEDFKDGTFLIVPQGGVGYRVEFDENLKSGSQITNVVGSDVFVVPFLGRAIVITAATSTSISASPGIKMTLRLGDNIQANGKTVRLIAVDDNGALFDVSGVIDNVNVLDSKKINGVELFLNDVVNSNQDANDRIIVTASDPSGEAVEVYNDGDEFVDENEDHYLWEWNLAGLDSTGKGNIT